MIVSKNLTNNELLSSLDKLYVVALVKKDLIWTLLNDQQDPLFDSQSVADADWRSFVEDIFFDLEYLAASRGLGWKPPIRDPARELNVSPKLERHIIGALKSTIHYHGPITREWVGSAAKRIMGAIKTYLRS